MRETVHGVSLDAEASASVPAIPEFDESQQEFFSTNFGISVEEANQAIEAGRWRGSLGAMLTDKECPVGDQIRQAYQEGGRVAVQSRMESLSGLFPEFKVSWRPTEEAPEQKEQQHPASKKK